MATAVSVSVPTTKRPLSITIPKGSLHLFDSPDLLSPDVAAKSCETTYPPNSAPVIALLINIARDTAGFTCAPEMPPTRRMIKAKVAPMINALPVAKMEINSKKVPRNSTRKGRVFILSITILEIPYRV